MILTDKSCCHLPQQGTVVLLSMALGEGNLIAWFRMPADRHSDPPTVTKITFYQNLFVLIADTMRQGSYFICYQTSFDATDDNRPNFTKIGDCYPT